MNHSLAEVQLVKNTVEMSMKFATFKTLNATTNVSATKDLLENILLVLVFQLKNVHQKIVQQMKSMTVAIQHVVNKDAFGYADQHQVLHVKTNASVLMDIDV